MDRRQALLITGGAGFIGSHLVKETLRRGFRVIVVDALTYAGSLENLKEVQNHPAFSFFQNTITDRKQLLETLKEFHVSAVLNLAAESHVDRSIDGASPFMETNILGTFQLLEASLEYWRSLSPDLKSEFRFLQVSTDEVFGDLGADGKFSESSPYDPHSPYSASKAAADHLVRAWYRTYDLPVLISHCSNNYGPFQYPEKLIPRVIHSALKQEPIRIYGEGKNIRDWIHVEDHVRGLLLTLEKGRPGRSYCLGGNSEMENLSLVKEICRLLDSKHSRENREPYENLIQFVSDRPGHDHRYAIDFSRAQSELGFQPSVPLDSGLEKTVDWYLDNVNWISARLGKEHTFPKSSAKLSKTDN